MLGPGSRNKRASAWSLGGVLEVTYALVVDPNAARRAFWASQLMMEGLASVLAADGAEAIARLNERGAPALLLTELALPRIDGFRVIDHLRRVAPPELTPVITVSQFRELREDAMLLRDRLAISLVLTPDVPPETLREAVRRLLDLPDSAPISITMPQLPDPRSQRAPLPAAAMRQPIAQHAPPSTRMAPPSSRRAPPSTPISSSRRVTERPMPGSRPSSRP